PVDQYPEPPSPPNPPCNVGMSYSPVTAGLKARLRNCLRLALDSDPLAQGKVVIAFDASDDGSIDAVKVVESTAPVFLQQCAVDALNRDSRPIADGMCRSRFTFPVVFMVQEPKP